MLKYAPLKSDFVRGVTADETIKSDIAEDMFSVPNEMPIETTSVDVVVDAETGEVLEGNA